MQKVRLTDQQVKIICTAFKKFFLAGDHIWLFGSRAKLDQKGGDIDLYIETNIKDNKGILQAKLDFMTELQLKLGEQKIDVVIKFAEPHLAIYDIAKSEGMMLT